MARYSTAGFGNVRITKSKTMDDNGSEETWILRESKCSDCDIDIAYGEWRTYLNNDKRHDKPICRSCAAKRLEDAIDTIPGSKKKYVKTTEDDNVRSRQVWLCLVWYGDDRCGIVRQGKD